MAENPAVEVPAIQDFVQSADNKQRTVQQTPLPKPTDLPRVPHDATPNASRQIYARLNAPTPMQEPWTYPVRASDWIPYFRSLWTSLIQVLYPNNPQPNNMIDEQEFIDVCHYLVRARCQYVARTQDPGLPMHHVLEYPDNLRIPSSFHRILMGLGTTLLVSELVFAYPVPVGARPLTVQELEQINNATPQTRAQVTAAIVNALPEHDEEYSNEIGPEVFADWDDFMVSIERKCACKVDYLALDTDGTKWYTIGVIAVARNAVATDENRVMLRSIDMIEDPMDSVMAAVVQRNFSGNLHAHEQTCLWIMPEINSVRNIRRIYNIDT